jgi:predicted transcriptional regulator
MAGKRIETMDVRQLISLKNQGLSNRKVAQLLHISRNTVNGYTTIFEQSGHSYEQLLRLDDLALKELCAPESEVSPERYEALASQFDYLLNELKKPGCTCLLFGTNTRKNKPILTATRSLLTILISGPINRKQVVNLITKQVRKSSSIIPGRNYTS